MIFKTTRYGYFHVKKIEWKGRYAGLNDDEATNIYKRTYGSLLISTYIDFIVDEGDAQHYNKNSKLPNKSNVWSMSSS